MMSSLLLGSAQLLATLRFVPGPSYQAPASRQTGLAPATKLAEPRRAGAANPGGAKRLGREAPLKDGPDGDGTPPLPLPPSEPGPESKPASAATSTRRPAPLAARAREAAEGALLATRLALAARDERLLPWRGSSFGPVFGGGVFSGCRRGPPCLGRQQAERCRRTPRRASARLGREAALLSAFRQLSRRSRQLWGHL